MNSKLVALLNDIIRTCRTAFTTFYGTLLLVVYVA